MFENLGPPAVLLARDLARCSTTQGRKVGPFSQETPHLNAFTLINLWAPYSHPAAKVPQDCRLAFCICLVHNLLLSQNYTLASGLTPHLVANRKKSRHNCYNTVACMSRGSDTARVQCTINYLWIYWALRALPPGSRDGHGHTRVPQHQMPIWTAITSSMFFLFLRKLYRWAL